MYPSVVTRLCIVIACVGGGSCASEVRPAAVAEALADSTCAIDRTSKHPDAIELIREFAERDGRGEFMQASAWFDGAVTCPGHEPGPDAAAIVRGHEQRALLVSGDSVFVEVAWDRVGYGGPAGDAIAPGTELDTLRAYRTPYGWRIASPALRPRMPVPPPPSLP